MERTSLEGQEVKAVSTRARKVAVQYFQSWDLWVTASRLQWFTPGNLNILLHRVAKQGDRLSVSFHPHSKALKTN